MSNKIKTIFFGLYFFTSAIYADIAYLSPQGVSLQLDSFYPSGSDYILVEKGSFYLVRAENSKNKIEKIVYEDHKFRFEQSQINLGKPLKFPKSQINNVIDRNFNDWKAAIKRQGNKVDRVLLREEDIPGCGLVRFFSRPSKLGYGGSDGNELLFSNNRKLDLQLDAVQHLQCDANGYAFGVIIQCGARNCTQYAIGFDLK